MTPDRIHQTGPQYQNPTYPKSFPDPYVLKHDGEYFAYCTGHWHDGRVFGVLRSRDLVNWTPVGGAMAELSEPSPFYWAPEVTYWNGKFYLYYSAGNETFMQLRVATSDRPDGGFEDCGRRLTTEDFAIDAHVFLDEDGQRYLFYATDFLEHSHIGTGVVVDRMVDWFTLAGDPRPAARAKYDWQVYDPQRKEKGGVRWHTVEGPFVLKRKGRYFMMFSGGNWQQPTYGVSFAVTSDLQTPDEWRQFSDGDKVLPILRTTPEKQVGPGHNSVVRGPNNRELYCVYHYWYEGERVLAINRMDFAGPRIFIDDKPYLARPLPLMPSPRYTFEADNWKAAGKWRIAGDRAENTGKRADIRSRPLPSSFLCEFSAFANGIDEEGRFGFRFESGGGVVGGLVLCVKGGKMFYEWIEADGEQRSGPLVFGDEFRPDALHRFTVELNHDRLCVKLDDNYLTIERSLAKPPAEIVLFAIGADAEFSGFALTEGFEDLFEPGREATNDLLGWEKSSDAAEIEIRGGELLFDNPETAECFIYKGNAAEEFEFAANFRLKGPAEPDASYGFLLADDSGKVLERFRFVEIDGRVSLVGDDGDAVAMPFDFNTRLFHQFKFCKRGGEIFFEIESVPLGSRTVDAGRARMGIFSSNARVAVEMARLTVFG